MTKVRLEIEGQLCDLANLFAALAKATASKVDTTPQVELSGVLSDRLVGRDNVSFLGSQLQVTQSDPQESPAISVGSQADENFNDDLTEQTDADGKPKRKRRTKEQIEADRLAAEQVNTPVTRQESLTEEHASQEQTEDKSGGFNAMMDNIEAEQAKQQAATEQHRVANEIEPDATNVLVNSLENSIKPSTVTSPPHNPLLAGINFDGPYIETMRKASQLMIAKNGTNGDLIKELLNEFNAKGLSEVKDEDKAAFKIRFKELPFKG